MEKKNLVLMDGAVGTSLWEKAEAKQEEKVAVWRYNLEDPEIVRELAKEYIDAGAQIILTNTFGANTLKFSEAELSEIIRTAVANAKAAREQSASAQEKYIALDIGPTGKLLKPFGDLDFEDAVNVFAKTVKLGVKYGVDLIIIETMFSQTKTIRENI